MISDPPSVDERLVGRHRWNVALLGLCFAAPLVVACFLRPDPSGHGTHRQLGLPPCTFVVLFDMRCPTCGMTTAWACVLHGRLVDGLRANVGGVLLCLMDFGVVAWLWVSAARARWTVFRPHPMASTWMLVGVVVVTLIDWIVRMR